MKCSRQVLLEVVLFQSRGHGHPQGDAMPNFFPDSKSSIKGFQMKYHLFLDSFAKFLKIEEGRIHYMTKCKQKGESVIIV